METLDNKDFASVESHVKAAEKFAAAPSRTNSAQVAKVALEQDPFNLDLIEDLGQCYAEASHWTQARNVMLRGRHRLKEFHSEDRRFNFSMRICEAQYQCKHFKDAVAVLEEINEPSDPGSALARAQLACRVYAAAKQKQRALKEFHRAVDGREFDVALRTWCLARLDLQAAGALETAKSMMERLADGDERFLAQLGTLEDLVTAENETSKTAAESGRSAPLWRKLRMWWATLPLRLQRLSRRADGSMRQCWRALSKLGGSVGQLCKSISPVKFSR